MMDDFNPYAAPVAPIAQPPPESDAPQTYRMSVKQGAWIWFKWSSILSVPIVALLLFVVCGALLYEVLKGRAASHFDRRFWVLLLSPFVFYLCTCLSGVVIGVLLSLVGHLVRADSRRHRT